MSNFFQLLAVSLIFLFSRQPIISVYLQTRHRRPRRPRRRPTLCLMFYKRLVRPFPVPVWERVSEWVGGEGGERAV